MIDPSAIAVRLKNVSRHFGEVRALDDISLDILDGEFFSMLGPSGSGKTTCLRLIAGFDLPTSGTIELHGKEMGNLPPYEREVNTVFQDYALFPHMTVADNVAYGLMIRKVAKSERTRRVSEMLELVQLPGMEQRKPLQLSGGQRQRVALARALILRPRVLLLDEPLGALDLKLRQQMQIELKAIQQRVGITFIYVTHDQEEALTMSDRIAVMNRGKLLQVGTSLAIYEEPNCRFVADFIGNINLLPVEVTASRPGNLHLKSPELGEILAPPAKADAGQRGTFALRPEQVRLYGRQETAELHNRFTGQVTDLLYLGDVTVYKVALDQGPVVEALMANAAPGRARFHEVGDPVTVAWRHDAGLFLDH